MSRPALTVKPLKGGFAVFRGEEVLTRTYSTPEAEDYVRRLSNPQETE